MPKVAREFPCWPLGFSHLNGIYTQLAIGAPLETFEKKAWYTYCKLKFIEDNMAYIVFVNGGLACY